MELESSGLTDAGPYRDTNEDSIGCFAPADALALQRKGYLYVVADGLGGHNAGEVASSSAVARLGEEYFSPSNHTRIEPALRQAVQAANLRIHELATQHPEYRSMETTLSAIAIAGVQAYVAHVGDTRIYHWRAGNLTQLTSDHSEAAELVRLRILKSRSGCATIPVATRSRAPWAVSSFRGQTIYVGRSRQAISSCCARTVCGLKLKTPKSPKSSVTYHRQLRAGSLSSVHSPEIATTT